LVIVTVKPSAVAVGVPKVGVRAALNELPATVAEPLTYPDRVVACVIVADVPGLKPVTVKTWFAPEGTPATTEPAETVGTLHVKAES
jgi:hypothetical protein